MDSFPADSVACTEWISYKLESLKPLSLRAFCSKHIDALMHDLRSFETMHTTNHSKSNTQRPETDAAWQIMAIHGMWKKTPTKNVSGAPCTKKDLHHARDPTAKALTGRKFQM